MDKKKENNEANNIENKTNLSRRNLFKVLVGSGVAVTAWQCLPAGWTRPVVEAVLLPAHAQLSVAPVIFGGAPLPVVSNGVPDDRTRVAGLMGRMVDAVVPAAVAAPSPTSTVCATLSGNLLTVTLQRSQNVGRRQGVLDINGAVGTLSVIAQAPGCTVDSVSASVSGFNPATGFTLNVVGGNAFSVFVPKTTSCPTFAALDGSCGL